jgi:hypothetical protein
MSPESAVRFEFQPIMRAIPALLERTIAIPVINSGSMETFWPGRSRFGCYARKGQPVF